MFMDSHYFSTCDFTLAVTLLLFGYRTHKIERDTNAQCSFFFERDENLDQVIRLFFRSEARVDPVAFSNAQKYLKKELQYTL